MPWTTPRTFVADELITAAMLNTHLRDNMLYLMGARDYSIASSTTEASTTSTSYVDVDSTNLAVEITPVTSRVLVFAHLCIHVDNTASNYGYYQLEGDNGAGTSSYAAQWNLGANERCFLLHVFAGLSAGTTYTFQPQYKAATGTVYVNWSSTYPNNSTVFAMEF